MQRPRTKLDRLLDLMASRQLTGLIVYSNGSCDVLSPSYLHYLSGVRPLGPNSAALISKAGAALLVEPPWDSGRVLAKSSIKDVRGTGNFVQDLIAIMRALRLAGPVGIVGQRQMTEAIYSELEKAADLKPAEALFDELSVEKDDKEIDLARKAGVIVDAGFSAFLEHSRVGIRECELLAHVEYAMRRAGADEIFNLMSAGNHNLAMHAPTDRRLMPGDTVIGEISAACEGQFVQVCRTVFLGKPGPVIIDKYDMLRKSLGESLRQVRAGAPASAISVAMNRVISDAGYRKYCYPPFMRARGHGFGPASTLPGTAIDEETKTMLTRNQVVVIHPNQYLPETGYIACGETFLVTDDGFKRLSESESKLYVREV